MSITMVSLSHHLLACLTLPLLVTLLARICKADGMYPFPCSLEIQKCDAFLYHTNTGLDEVEIASYHSVDPSTFRPISHGNNKDYLIPVSCSCGDIDNGPQAYFYDVYYTVQEGDTFRDVSARFYDGKALEVGGEENNFLTGSKVTMHLICGCLESQSTTVVTYTVQQGDTLSSMATQLSTSVNDIQSLNGNLTSNPNFIKSGWVLYVPAAKDRIPAVPKRSEWCFNSRSFFFFISDCFFF